MAFAWDDFEQLLLEEFDDIMKHFRSIRCKLSPEVVADFLGLVQYTCAHHSALESVLKGDELAVKFTKLEDNLRGNLSMSIVDELIECDLNSFAPEFALFPKILIEKNSFSRPSLYSLCKKYWKCRYPSVKESFIIPLCADLFSSHPEDLKDQSDLVNLVRSRLSCGIFEPFDESLKLCQVIGIDLNDDFSFVHQTFSTLKDILSNHQNSSKELESVLKQSGCHCD